MFISSNRRILEPTAEPSIESTAVGVVGLLRESRESFDGKSRLRL